MLDHSNTQLLGWVCGDRSTATGQAIIEGRDRYITRIFSDYYPSYSEIAGAIPLVQSKSYTVQIERNNGRQRRWLACFHRRGQVVSRTLPMLHARLKLFARYRVNGCIQELTALLRAPSKVPHPISILK
jgi:IS1 family transposase